MESGLATEAGIWAVFDLLLATLELANALENSCTKSLHDGIKKTKQRLACKTHWSEQAEQEICLAPNVQLPSVKQMKHHLEKMGLCPMNAQMTELDPPATHRLEKTSCWWVWMTGLVMTSWRNCKLYALIEMASGSGCSRTRSSSGVLSTVVAGTGGRRD